RTTKAPSRTEKACSACRTSGFMMFFSSSEYPWNGFNVSWRDFSITVLESPTTNSAPTGRPSHPSTPTDTASSISVSITPGETPSACRNPNDPLLGSDGDDQDRVGISRRLTGQEPDHHVTLFVDPAGDTAHERDLQLLGTVEVVVGERQDLHARGLDHVALVFAHHRLDEPLAGTRLAAKQLLGER